MEEQRVEFQEETITNENGEERSITTYQIRDSATEGKAIAALVLGIAGIVLANLYTAILALPAGIIGIVYGKKARELTFDGSKKGFGIATAGFICSIVAVCLAGIMILFGIWILIWMSVGFFGAFGLGNFI